MIERRSSRESTERLFTAAYWNVAKIIPQSRQWPMCISTRLLRDFGVQSDPFVALWKASGCTPSKKNKKTCALSKRQTALWGTFFSVTFFSYERDYVSKLGAEPGGLQKKLAPRSCSLPEKFQSNHDRSVIITAVISVCDFITVSLYIHCRADLWRWESTRKNKYNLAHGLIIRVALLFSNIKDSYGLQTASWFCKYIFN